MTIPLTFFGSDQYSATVMQTLIASPEVTITNLITTTSDPQSPKTDPPWAELHQLAKSHNIPITYYPDFLTSPARTILAGKIGILASFGHLIPPSILNLFPSGILCLHPSLLPQYRNTSPVPYAIALGDKTTGITLFQIDNTVDNGKILAQQKEPILPSDTSPILLHRLFTIGAKLVISHLTQPAGPGPVGIKPHHPLIFTHKLTSESGHLEWEVVQKLINNQPITASDTNNKLLKLRLSRLQPSTKYHQPNTILTDLIRALDGWEKVWTIAKTKKGNLRISLTLPLNFHQSPTTYHILISGKPNPISWNDFQQYYL